MVIDDPRPGFKWPVRVAQPINASAERVWDVISMAGNLEPCHPFCEKNPVAVWPGDGARDEIHYLSGLVLERKFSHWFDGAGYDLEIGKVGGPTSFVSWRITPIDKHQCSLKITVYPYVLQNFPSALRWLPYVVYVGPMLRRYLSSVTRGFEWTIVRGEAVPRNQFGRHPWFSAPKSASGS